MIAGFLLDIGFKGWTTLSGGVGVGISSTRICGGAFGKIDSGIGPLARIPDALFAGTWVEGFVGLQLGELEGFAGTKGGLRAESAGIFALREAEPWSD